MEKRLIAFFMILLLFPLVSAVDLKVEKVSQREVMIPDLDKPAIVNVKITNLGSSNNFQFYNLLGFRMAPIGTIPIGIGKTENVELLFYPKDSMRERGFYTFQYYIRGDDGSEQAESVTIKIIDFEDSFEIGTTDISPDSTSTTVYIHNKEYFNFEKTKAEFSSPFFEFERDFTLGPNEKKEFLIELNKEDFSDLIAGYYTINAKVYVEDKEADVEGKIKFVEKSLSTTTKKDLGLFINTKTISITNEGNTITQSNNVINKNIVSRLFTTFSPEPDTIDRNGLSVNYGWQKEVKPGETLNIVTKTNWLFPFLLVFFIVVIVVFTKKYSETDIVLKKRVSFVKAKGGEFALKVSIIVNAKKYVEKVSVIDRLPPLVRIHERFGGEQPKRINEKSRRIEWDFEKLEEGEIRMISYVIYSKVGVLGRFALPRTTAVYERQGKLKESESNKAFFIAEQTRNQLEEEN